MIWDVSSDFPTEICGILITKLGDIHNYAYMYTYRYRYGSVSKPCTPGEHQNSWQMDVHPTKNGINRY